jgi:caffeoyl-CoA O-methyltransferase
MVDRRSRRRPLALWTAAAFVLVLGVLALARARTGQEAKGAPATGAVAHAPASAAAARTNPPATAPSASASVPAAVAAILTEIKAADSDLLAVSEEDGEFLRLMAATAGATRALEIGGAQGYSAIWIALALRGTGGRLTTIEYDPGRAQTLAANIRRAGLADIVTVVPGDAFTAIPTLDGPFDFVFLDAWKRDYKRFFDLLLPRLRPGGLFLAHNVVNKRSEMPDFLNAIRSNPAVMTAIVAPAGEGMSVSLKLR